MARLLLVMMLVMACGARRAHAQQPAPFEWVEVRAGGAQNVNHNFLHEFWQQGTGAEVAAATPFYLGYAEAGGAFHRYRVDQTTVPAFSAILLYAGWGLGTDVMDRLRLEAGGRVGNYRMTFDEVTFTGVKNESELALLLHARLAVRPAGPVSVYLGGSYMKVYTFVRLNLWYVSAGVSYRLRSPDWLKTLLN